MRLAFRNDLRTGVLVGLLSVMGVGTAQAQPGWSVNPADFESGLTATVSVQISGATGSNPADILAAFVGEEIRGVVSGTEIGSEVLFFLVIYGDGQGYPVSFRYYDSVGDRVCDLAENVTFAPNAILGSLSAPLELSSACLTSTAVELPQRGGALNVTGVFPNPATDLVNLDLDAVGPVRIDLLDILGRLVSRTDWDLGIGPGTVRLSTEHLKSGTYLIRIQAGDKTHVTSIAVRTP